MKLKSFEDLKKAMEAQSEEDDRGRPFYRLGPWVAHGETYPAGWFFWDEAYYIHGPYASREKAEQGLTAYCQNELGEKP